MSGSKDKGLARTQRDHRIFQALLDARLLDCENVKLIGPFGSTRRANDRLLQLVRAGQLRRWFVATEAGGQKAIYGLSRESGALVGETPNRLISWPADELITGGQFIAHQQAVNSVLMQVRFRTPPASIEAARWLTFNLPLSLSVPLVPDGYFELKSKGNVLPHFLEMDRGTESSRIWQKKIQLYLKLAISGEFETLFHQQRFRVLVVCNSERRLRNLRKTVSKQTDKLFWFSTLNNINEGLWEAIWLRPVGDSKHSLL